MNTFFFLTKSLVFLLVAAFLVYFIIEVLGVIPGYLSSALIVVISLKLLSNN